MTIYSAVSTRCALGWIAEEVAAARTIFTD